MELAPKVPLLRLRCCARPAGFWYLCFTWILPSSHGSLSWAPRKIQFVWRPLSTICADCRAGRSGFFFLTILIRWRLKLFSFGINAGLPSPLFCIASDTRLLAVVLKHWACLTSLPLFWRVFSPNGVVSPFFVSFLKRISVFFLIIFCFTPAVRPDIGTFPHCPCFCCHWPLLESFSKIVLFAGFSFWFMLLAPASLGLRILRSSTECPWVFCVSASLSLPIVTPSCNRAIVGPARRLFFLHTPLVS